MCYFTYIKYSIYEMYRHAILAFKRILIYFFYYSSFFLIKLPCKILVIVENKKISNRKQNFFLPLYFEY